MNSPNARPATAACNSVPPRLIGIIGRVSRVVSAPTKAAANDHDVTAADEVRGRNIDAHTPQQMEQRRRVIARPDAGPGQQSECGLTPLECGHGDLLRSTCFVVAGCGPAAARSDGMRISSKAPW